MKTIFEFALKHLEKPPTLWDQFIYTDENRMTGTENRKQGEDEKSKEHFMITSFKMHNILQSSSLRQNVNNAAQILFDRT